MELISGIVHLLIALCKFAHDVLLFILVDQRLENVIEDLLRGRIRGLRRIKRGGFCIGCDAKDFLASARTAVPAERLTARVRNSAR